MTVYTVHQPLAFANDPLKQVDQLVFIKEGFSWLALLFPVFWLIFHRMWLVLIGFIVVFFAVQWGLLTLGLSEDAVGIMTSLLLVGFAFEANTFKRWTLGRSGYKMIAAVTGKSLGDCELKFFSGWSPDVLKTPLDERHIPGTLAATAALGRL